MEDDDKVDEDLLVDSRCANCGAQWRMEREGGISVWQARCTNLHGCGMRGPRNHYWSQAAHGAWERGLYLDQNLDTTQGSKT